MADPQHTPEMDRFDRLTVRLYRLGVGVTTTGLLLQAPVLGFLDDVDRLAVSFVAVGVALCLSNLHLYSKHVRWVMGTAGWLGMTGGVIAHLWSAPPFVHAVALGFLYVAASAVALKEQFCFRVPFLRFVPVFLAMSVLAQLDALTAPYAGIPAALAGIPYGVLAFAKTRMPLHFDVGDRANYEV